MHFLNLVDIHTYLFVYWSSNFTARVTCSYDQRCSFWGESLLLYLVCRAVENLFWNISKVRFFYWTSKRCIMFLRKICQSPRKYLLPFCYLFLCNRALKWSHFIIAVVQALKLLFKICSLSHIVPFWPDGYWEAPLLQKQLYSLWNAYKQEMENLL